MHTYVVLKDIFDNTIMFDVKQRYKVRLFKEQGYIEAGRVTTLRKIKKNIIGKVKKGKSCQRSEKEK